MRDRSDSGCWRWRSTRARPRRARCLPQACLPSVPSCSSVNPCWGVWSRKVTADTVLEAGDRLEVYRPLLADPKTARRQRAVRQRAVRPRNTGKGATA